MTIARDGYRRIALLLFAISVWLVFCLPSLFANHPEAFQASGSLIVVMAILIYAKERARRQSAVTLAQRRQIVAMLEEHDTWGAFHESRATRSALETESQLLEIRCLVSTNEALALEMTSRMKEINTILNESSGHHEQLQQQMQKSHANWVAVHNDAEEIVHLQAPEAKALERLEIALVVLGTLQWGYGDRLAMYLHNVI